MYCKNIYTQLTCCQAYWGKLNNKEAEDILLSSAGEEGVEYFIIRQREFDFEIVVSYLHTKKIADLEFEFAKDTFDNEARKLKQ